MHNILEDFEFQPDRITGHGVICLLKSEKYPHRLAMLKVVFSWLFLN